MSEREIVTKVPTASHFQRIRPKRNCIIKHQTQWCCNVSIGNFVMIKQQGFRIIQFPMQWNSHLKQTQQWFSWPQESSQPNPTQIVWNFDSCTLHQTMQVCINAYNSDREKRKKNIILEERKNKGLCWRSEFFGFNMTSACINHSIIEYAVESDS